MLMPFFLIGKENLIKTGKINQKIMKLITWGREEQSAEKMRERDVHL